MSEALTRTQPVPTEPLAGNQVTLRAAPPMARFSLRARRAADLKDILGFAAPGRIGATASGVACLGPDEWLWRAPDGTPMPDASGRLVAITDISHRQIGIIVEGPRAVDVLCAGCPLDLAGFAIGRVTRTIFETVEIIVEREAADRFHVEVWRSFAPYLWATLASVAGE